MAISELNKYLDGNQLDLTRITEVEAPKVKEACINQARMDRLQSAGYMFLSGTAALGDKVLMPSAVAIVAFQVAEIVSGLLLFPLAIVYPLYTMSCCLFTICGGLGAFGLYMGYRNDLVPNVKNYSDEFFKMAQAHWNTSNHWYHQAERLNP